jgi:hypothetical protein
MCDEALDRRLRSRLGSVLWKVALQVKQAAGHHVNCLQLQRVVPRIQSGSIPSPNGIGTAGFSLFFGQSELKKSGRSQNR